MYVITSPTPKYYFAKVVDIKQLTIIIYLNYVFIN